MKKFPILVLFAVLAGGCEIKKVPVFLNRSSDFRSNENLPCYPAVILTPETNKGVYSIDANGQLIQEETVYSSFPIDSSSNYFRMLQRMKRMPESSEMQMQILGASEMPGSNPQRMTK